MFSNTPHFHAVSQTVVYETVPEVRCSFCRCPEQPAIEITRIVDIDIATGEVNLPPNLR